jgi:hypothetical protein
LLPFFSASVVFTSNERCQKFRIETTAASVVIVRDRRTIFSEELFVKSCSEQALSYARLFYLEFRRHRDVSI